MRLFLALFLCSAPAFATTPLPTTIGTGMALEGDLVSVNGAAVKLWGIDAPDVGQSCFNHRGQSYDCHERSKQALMALIGQNQIECHIRSKDSHGQQVGTCGVNGLDLAAMMVRDGWAMAFHGLSPHYAKLEAIAQAKERGLWSGTAETPWQWRTTQQLSNRNK